MLVHTDAAAALASCTQGVLHGACVVAGARARAPAPRGGPWGSHLVRAAFARALLGCATCTPPARAAEPADRRARPFQLPAHNTALYYLPPPPPPRQAHRGGRLHKRRRPQPPHLGLGPAVHGRRLRVRHRRARAARGPQGARRPRRVHHRDARVPAAPAAAAARGPGALGVPPARGPRGARRRPRARRGRVRHERRRGRGHHPAPRRRRAAQVRWAAQHSAAGRALAPRALARPGWPAAGRG